VKNKDPEQEVLLTPAEAAGFFGVDPKTITRWAVAGKIASTRTLGGHRRFKEADVLYLREHGFKKTEDAQ
jgi:excisionase family DNA binding protein